MYEVKARTYKYTESRLQYLDISQHRSTTLHTIHPSIIKNQSLYQRHTFSPYQTSNMYNFNTLLTLASLATTALATSSEPTHYRLKTEVKPHQRGKGSYNNLYLTTYHTGAGLNDATFVKNSSDAAVGYLNGTSTSTAKAPDNAQLFDLSSNTSPWYDATQCFSISSCYFN
jgi:hypothetical protein